MKSSIGVVVVTYNRLDKLKITMGCFKNQLCSPKYIVVVNNASTDGTEKYLEVWKNTNENEVRKYVINKDKNTGGSGGFYTGLEFAQTLDADWIWVSDDDAFPDADALMKVQENIDKDTGRTDVSAYCGMVINHGKIDFTHRKDFVPRKLTITEKFSTKDDYEKDRFEIQAFSYVGSVINKDKLIEVGLPIQEYFIWCDDTEHSLRLHNRGKIYCLPGVKIHHDVAYQEHKTNWKTYYGFRNLADMYRRHFPKRYFIVFCANMIRKTYMYDLQHIHEEENKEIRCALCDAMHRRLGIHNVYKPGWKPID